MTVTFCNDLQQRRVPSVRLSEYEEEEKRKWGACA